MEDFLIYLHLGFKHIIDWGGLDHLLFIFSLTIRYIWKDWKQILLLVTAFTLGHSITLALSTLNWVVIPSTIIEILIPLTILLTSLVNFRLKSFLFNEKYPIIYFFALFFGLIHGLGFSYYLKSLLGKEETIWAPLLAFNIGLELGQLLTVVGILIISFIFVGLIKVDRKSFVRSSSALVFLFALKMVLERIMPLMN